jgi:hypothetical protein
VATNEAKTAECWCIGVVELVEEYELREPETGSSMKRSLAEQFSEDLGLGMSVGKVSLNCQGI